MDIAFLITYFKTLFIIFITVMWGYSPKKSGTSDEAPNSHIVIYEIKAEEMNAGYYLNDYEGEVDKILITNAEQQNPQLLGYYIYNR